MHKITMVTKTLSQKPEVELLLGLWGNSASTRNMAGMSDRIDSVIIPTNLMMYAIQ